MCCFLHCQGHAAVILGLFLCALIQNEIAAAQGALSGDLHAFGSLQAFALKPFPDHASANSPTPCTKAVSAWGCFA